MSVFKYIIAILLSAIYACFGYFLNPENTIHLVILFTSSFLLYFIILFTAKDKNETDILLWISMFFRLIFIVSIPTLSTDFWRIIWDGRLLLDGYNPNLYLPSELSSFIEKNELLYSKLTGEHYSFSSSFTLLFSAISGFFSNFSLMAGIIALRIPILIAEFIIIKYIRKLLEYFHLPHYHVLWYALNPLVIITVVGNLYLEGIMLMLVVIGIYWLIINKWTAAGILWGLASSITFLPLLFIPVLTKRLGTIKSVWFIFSVVLVIFLCYLPFYNISVLKLYLYSLQVHFFNVDGSSIINILTSLFNLPEGSVPYMLIVISIIGILVVYFFNNNTWQTSLNKLFFGYTIYLLVVEETQPVHIVCLILLSTFVKNYSYAILWSIIILFSHDNNLMALGGKLIVCLWIFFELFKNKQLAD